ncbi:ABC transporter permease [Granulicatella seriolae]|uniref:ABC transporter permease n=1 Tax=Granulicatella seriolae TaxID=2967226 RepID=A0ABT1WMD9_9LACT|nr:ABC transporter permease [Granulicatella seriolae]
MIEYLMNYHDDLLKATIGHFQLVITSLFLALLLSMVLVYAFIQHKNWLKQITYFFSVLYSVPSYAFFALLIPLSGLGFTTAVVVLTLYSEYILLRNFLTGIQEINPQIIEAAIGMGMTERQVFFNIQLPLSSRAIFSGIRLALTSIIGIATIAATINAGGLGVILFDGLRTQSLVKIAWGTLLTILLCLMANGLIQLLERVCLRKLYLEGR